MYLWAGIVTRLRDGLPRNRGSIPRRARGILLCFSKLLWPVLGLAESPIKALLGALYPGMKRLEREADQYLHLVSRLRVRGAILALHHMPSWREEDSFYFYIQDVRLKTGPLARRNQVCGPNLNRTRCTLFQKKKICAIILNLLVFAIGFISSHHRSMTRIRRNEVTVLI
jgi:hypothetical protein